jgi:NADPH2:quinone reductase
MRTFCRQPRGRLRSGVYCVAAARYDRRMSRGIVMQATGGPEVLREAPHDPGPPGAGTARVRVAAAGVNFIDVYFRTGAYPPPLPFVLGLEGAGEVEAVGPDVREVAVGDRVAWASVPGSYAGAIVAPVDRLVRVPAGVSLETAAAAMLQGMTAHYLAHGTRETRHGDTALVHAAAGGVGLLLVQTLRAAGARVIGTCSTAEKEALAREAGAHDVIRYGEVDFADETRRLTAGRGVDVVYDGVGRTTFDGSLRALRIRGLCVLYGQSSGAVPPLDLQRLNQGGSLFVTRPSLTHYTQDRAELEMRAGAVLGAIAAGALRVRIGARFPLAQAAESHRALEGRATTGKVLLIP